MVAGTRRIGKGPGRDSIMSSLSMLLAQVNDYLDEKLNSNALEDWIVAHLQVILDSEDERAVNLANEIDVSFVELGEGIIDLAALRDRLEKLVDLHEVVS
jgi:hypothetical protein